MTQDIARPQPAVETAAETAIRALYHEVLDCWNGRSAQDMAALFDQDANMVGFDGSPVNGRAEIESHLRQVFTDHVTATYIAKVREVRFLSPEIAMLRAIVGMIPPGKSDINPAVNAIQTLVAVWRDGRWRGALLQSTPAQFHGRPEIAEQLTDELRKLL
jgi:uncharacterized protein (TIGR02246 family)